MCLIVHRPNTGAHLPQSVIDYNRSLNPDGFGLAWRDGEDIKHIKFGPEGFREFADLLRSVDKLKVEYAAHFRRATHGAACKDLSHPFLYEDPQEGPVLVFHNGIINIGTKANESDTSAFVDRVLTGLPTRWWANNALRWLVEGSIGWSRLLLMTLRETDRINDASWVKKGGIWYSTTPEFTYSSKGKSDKPKKWEKKVTAETSLLLLPSGTPPDDYAEALRADLLPEANAQPVKGQDGKGWFHQGHYCLPVDTTRDDSGEYGIARCVPCDTTGNYYVLEGRGYLDVPHIDFDADDEEEPF